MRRKILFVCTGNTCRSPMAEALFKNLLEERDDLGRKFVVSSAGVYAFEGDPATHEAIAALREDFDIDITSHRARVLDDRDIREAWLILTMTAHHKEMILELYPQAADKAYTLRDYAEAADGHDISDPYGRDLATYKKCAGEIESLLMDIADKLE